MGPNGFRAAGPGGVKPGAGPNVPGGKKLIIKNLKVKPTLPEQFESRALEKLRRAVVAIQQAKAIDTSLEELYQSVESLCSHGMSEQVSEEERKFLIVAESLYSFE